MIDRLAARSVRNSSRSLMIYSASLHPKAIARESHLLTQGRLNFILRHYPSVVERVRQEKPLDFGGGQNVKSSVGNSSNLTTRAHRHAAAAGDSIPAIRHQQTLGCGLDRKGPKFECKGLFSTVTDVSCR